LLDPPLESSSLELLPSLCLCTLPC